MDTSEYIRESMRSLRDVADRDGEACRKTYDVLADNRLVEFAGDAMRGKLARARLKGRGGWWRQEECRLDRLRSMLREHVDKGDMRDVMNLAAMIYVREIMDAPTPSEVTEHREAGIA